MAQCKKILDSGEQCSNRAVPGTEYCEAHRRISFRPVEKTKTPSPPPGKPQPKAPAPLWRARPIAAGDTPVFPGLHPDKRNILTAPTAIIHLTGESPETRRQDIFSRLVRILSCLSMEIPLPRHVIVETLDGLSEILVTVTPPPPHPQSPGLSPLYDTIAAAVRLNGGRLYIGEERTYIQYRDAGAPRGYDAKDVKPPPQNQRCLIDENGVLTINNEKWSQEPLDKLILRIGPTPTQKKTLPAKAYALIVPALYTLLARYFQAHHLEFQVAGFQSDRGDELVLFALEPRPGSPTGTLIPAFILSYLDNLPRCATLTEVETQTGQKVLLQWNYQHPLQIEHILAAYPPDALLVFPAGPDFPNMIITPAPHFLKGENLITGHFPRLAKTAYTPAAIEKRRLEIPVRFIPDTGPMPAPVALILTGQEMAWVRALLYKLPPGAFETYRFSSSEEYTALLGNGPMETFPFGIPLKRIFDSELFIPMPVKIIPSLPWSVMVEVMELRPGYYTFITTENRLEVPIDSFAPLSRALVAEEGRPRVKFEIRPMPQLPELKWTPPPSLETGPAAHVQPGKSKLRKSPGRVVDRGSKENWFQNFERILIGEKSAGKSSQELDNREGLGEIFATQAEILRQTGDFLGAAVCFDLSGDKANAGRCYKEAAERLKANKNESSIKRF